jgi:hypothetical protein
MPLNHFAEHNFFSVRRLNDNEILFSFFSFPLSADVGEYVDSLNPPPLDDQRYLELMVYR